MNSHYRERFERTARILELFEGHDEVCAYWTDEDCRIMRTRYGMSMQEALAQTEGASEDSHAKTLFAA